MPPPSRLATPAHMDDFLLFRLSRLLATAGTLVIRLCEGQYGITRREWRLLSLLARHDLVLPSQLADLAQLDRTRTSRALSSLLAKKLIVRIPVHSDRRQAQIRLSEAGQRICTQLLPQVKALNQELLQGLSAQEVDDLDRMLDQLQARASQTVALHSELPKADRRRGGRTRHLLD